jgi:hypothetical protein
MQAQCQMQCAASDAALRPGALTPEEEAFAAAREADLRARQQEFLGG